MSRLGAWLRTIFETPKGPESEEPHQGLRYSVEEMTTLDGGLIGYRWQCFHCYSGTGDAPDLGSALLAADIHYGTNHTQKEVTI